MSVPQQDQSPSQCPDHILARSVTEIAFSYVAYDYPPEVVDEALRIIDLMKQDAIRISNSFRALDATWYVTFLAKEKIPLPPNPRNGRDYPEGMPDEYQLLPFLADVKSLPDEHLHTWLNFYNKAYTDNLSRSQKEVMLLVALGETPLSGISLEEDKEEEDIIDRKRTKRKKNGGGNKRARNSATPTSSSQAKDKRPKRNPKK
ncbi:hypothetical protein V865_002295 [Kwoniella europaea PYCC6329]|uniref:Uncharacterized protein n=1 Tax=Kwoniella europaea PYCC6329 TaxID=1423913 RepID=A0AAX4KCK8_9TREE